jgi:hypothetical protein
MSGEVLPIKEGVSPSLDVEREMLSYVSEKLAEYSKMHGQPPASIAFVLVGHGQAGSQTDAYSWSPADETISRLHTCAAAAAVLTKRALGL